ncbi:AlkZ family DNA glycosylase [Leucobacter denitrificans]|uniref:AlkZ family DNA glycosylase n=2 Tax=Leucobacter denitrificans TaxID=683042 RepID=A0A7G9S7P8_9MICO|nr:AlkZ family DNA glycosylase [Leucobacter denitrificans]
MRALGLDGAGVGDPRPGERPTERVLAVVHHLFALQGQDWRSSQWAVGSRAPDLTAANVREALGERLIVRSWPMRGTVHLVAAQDIGWIQSLTNPRMLAGAPKRREYLGMSDAVLERVTDITVQALSGGKSLSRDELGTVWTEAGVEWQSNWRYHLIWWLCQNGITTFGPVDADSEPRIVLASEWIESPRSLTGDEALQELAARYVRGRGAASQKDLAWWTNMKATDVKRAFLLAEESGAVMAAQRDTVTGAAGALWVDPHSLDAATEQPSAEPTWRLLAAFDEHLLGYNNREPQLAPGMLDRIVPGKNGMFLATIVCDGRVVGTWRRNTKNSALELTAFPGETIDTQALEPEITRLADFYDFSFSQVVVT